MKIEDTTEGMNSSDWKERFKAEYWQVKIRWRKLHRMLVKYEAGTLDFEPDCTLGLLKKQAFHMESYIHILEVRAEIENIDLGE